jgi:PAS domain S-box-containing protein
MPLRVMWSVHDDAQKCLKNILSYLEDVEEKEHDLVLEIGEFYYMVYGLLQKQELILYPVASYVLEKQDFDEMYNECLDLGYAYIDSPKTKIQIEDEEHDEENEGVLYSSFTGTLTKEQLQLTLDTIPVDITYVDEDDKVVYFNNAKDRLFPRSPSVIGRTVDKCHPPESVHVVNKIVEAFKAGKKDKAMFWLQMKKKFILIQYFALRDEQGNYKGVLEASQDVTEIKSLEGQHKILDWEE